MVRFTIVIVLSVTGAAVATAQSGYDLFQQALVMERSAGQVRDAIDLYARISVEYATDRPLAARALVRLGRAYEMLGRREAAAAYERVLQEYPEQRDMVEQARERLAALRTATASPTVRSPARRLILDGSPGVWAATTRDGEHLLRYDNRAGAFVLEEMATGATRSLTSGGLTNEYESGGVWWYDLAHDGTRIAALVLTFTDSTIDNDLRLFDVGGRGAGRSIATWTKQRSRLIGWAPDDSKVWVWNMHFSGEADIASVDVDDGTVTVIKTLAYRRHTQPPSLSPDGRFIAYHDAPDAGEATDIFILATDGSMDFRVAYPGPDSKPIFTPDGSGVVFDSDRRGGRDLWFLPLADGRPSGPARLVWRDMGPYGEARRFSDNGSLFYYFATFQFSTYVANLEELDGVGGATMIPPRYREMNAIPAWSPDGTRLAYRRGRRDVVIQDLAAASEQEFAVFSGTSMYGSIDWCDDVSLIVTGGIGSGNVGQRFGTYRLDLKTGDTTLILEGGEPPVRCLASHDAIAYVDRLSEESPMIVRRSLATGEVLRLYEGPLWSNALTRSPDDEYLGFIEHDSLGTRLMVIPSRGGAPRELLSANNHTFESSLGLPSILHAAWMPDGREILIVRLAENIPGVHSTDEDPIRKELWAVPVDGGPPAKVGTLPPEFDHAPRGLQRAVSNLSVHPDGTRIAFDRRHDFIEQIWAIDNLLQRIQSELVP